MAITIDRPTSESQSFGLPQHLEGPIANYIEFLLRNATATGGGNLIWGEDSITATTRTGDRLDTLTKNGITWTLEWSVDTLLRAVAWPGTAWEIEQEFTLNAYGDYEANPAGNIFINGNEINTPLAKAKLIHDAAVAASITLQQGTKFSIPDLATSINAAGVTRARRCTFAWDGVQLVPVFGCYKDTLVQASHSTSSGLSPVLASLSWPGWLMGVSGNILYARMDLAKTGGTSGTINPGIQLNTNIITGGTGGAGVNATAAVNQRVRQIATNSQHVPAGAAGNSGGYTNTSSVDATLSINTLTTDLTLDARGTLSVADSVLTLKYFRIGMEAG